MNADIQKEIRQAWRKWRRRYWPLARRYPIQRQVRRSAIREEKDKKLLQPWLAIADEAIHFLVHLFELTFEERGKGRGDPAFMSVVGRCANLSLAIRTLLVAGYDQAARPLLRALFENLDVATVIFHDPEFATDFQTLGDDDSPLTEQEFWRRKVAYGRIHEAVAKAAADVGIPDDDQRWFVEHRRQLNNWLSPSTHSSSAAAFLSCMTPSLAQPGYLVPALFGTLSIHSPSPLSTLKLWVDEAELDAGLLNAESPVDAYAVAVAGLIPRSKL